MVDFRYHIVSLISVFLALAIGIVLGAGPLRESLGDTLSNQVEVLREEKDQLRTELDDSERQRLAAEELITVAQPELNAGLLDTYRVAVVHLGEIDPEDVTEVQTGLTAAGAEVVSNVQLTDEWIQEGRASFRAGIAESLTEYLEESPDSTIPADQVLSSALAQALTRRDVSVPTDPAVQNASILEILGAADLITPPEGTVQPADAIVVLVARQTDEDLTEPNAAMLQSLAGFGSVPALAVGDSSGVVDVISAIRDNETFRSMISTSDALGTSIESVLVPRIVAGELAGTTGHYSLIEDDVALWPPRVELAPWEAPEPPSEEESATEDVTGDDTSTEGEPSEEQE